MLRDSKDGFGFKFESGVFLIFSNKWTIRKWEDAATLSLWIALLYAGLHAPYVVNDPFTGSYFMINVLHKFCMCFVILYVLDHFRQYD